MPFQAVNGGVFFFTLQPSIEDMISSSKSTLLADEENAIRYASGYGPMKFFKHIDNCENNKTIQYNKYNHPCSYKLASFIS